MVEGHFDSDKDIDPQSLAFRFARYLNGLIRNIDDEENKLKFFTVFLATTVPFLSLDEEIVSSYQPEIDKVNALFQESKVREAGIVLTGFATSLFQFYSQEDLRVLEEILNEQDTEDYGDDDYLSEISMSN